MHSLPLIDCKMLSIGQHSGWHAATFLSILPEMKAFRWWRQRGQDVNNQDAVIALDTQFTHCAIAYKVMAYIEG